MPIKQSTEKPKSSKDLLLELIQKNYGASNAVIMDKALKTQDKQVEEAMLQGGMTAEDIARSKGIDMNSVNQVLSKQLNGETTDQSLGYQTKPASSPFGFGGATMQNGNVVEQQPGFLAGLLMSLISGNPKTSANMDLNRLTKVSNLQQESSPLRTEEKNTLIAQRKANTALMEKMLSGQEEGNVARTIYRDPITGEEVDPEIAQKDMEEGLGIYQMNQVISTRSGVVEKPLNKVPELTQEEKKYVNDARMMESSLGNLESGYDGLYSKYGKANWQSFQIENMPYLLSQDPTVQSLKSELIYLKAAIPFMRGGKQLTKEEGRRIDVMLNPFGKSKETYKKDINRFKTEFGFGADIMKFGVNAGIMKKLVNVEKKKERKSSFKVIGVR